MSDSNKLIKAWGNHEKRQAFVKAYKGWDVWLVVPQLELTFFQYEMPDGTIILAMEHQTHDYLGHQQGYGFKAGVTYYVQKAGEPFLPNNQSSLWVVADLLKDAKASLQSK